ncbi:MAG: phosphomannomutase/phosphoglucomutase [Syntrophales bacterium]|nr:phosphomannomutase/phosphoglucomutase [Syntrophales bacterium]MDD5531823.1 phosphomannomutase/phosphoglucomutase [Syntrophales bacterium]
MNSKVFREYDVRGTVDQDLNDDFVFNLGRASGTYAGSKGVRTMTLGRDCRLSSGRYGEAMREGLLSTGIDVIDLGMCATPILYFSIRELKAGGGVMITGSHNPPEFNGFKICVGPDTIYGEDIQDLRRIMESGAYASGRGKSRQEDVSERYKELIFNNVRIKPGIDVAVDAGNGVGGIFALPILERFGCSVTPLYCDVDGRFPNHFPDPTVPENLRELIQIVKKKGSDAGIAFDGDADRIGVITDKGEILWGDELLLFFSRFVLQENPGAAVIGEVKCSHRLYNDIERHGGRAVMWKAGHSLIKGKMKEIKALLAGEMSGHVFFADRYFGYDDAIYAAARLLEILSRTGKKISEIMADVPRTFNTPEIRVDCPDAVKFEVVEDLKEGLKKEHKIIDLDGVRIPFEDGWGLIRASNTQPVLVLRFEASTPGRLAEIRNIIESALDETMKKFAPDGNRIHSSATTENTMR